MSPVTDAVTATGSARRIPAATRQHLGACKPARHANPQHSPRSVAATQSDRWRGGVLISSAIDGHADHALKDLGARRGAWLGSPSVSPRQKTSPLGRLAIASSAVDDGNRPHVTSGAGGTNADRGCGQGRLIPIGSRAGVSPSQRKPRPYPLTPYMSPKRPRKNDMGAVRKPQKPWRQHQCPPPASSDTRSGRRA